MQVPAMADGRSGDDDAAKQRIARLERENAQLVERLVRLGQAVQGLAADAVQARQEAAALRRRHEADPDRTEDPIDGR